MWSFFKRHWLNIRLFKKSTRRQQLRLKIKYLGLNKMSLTRRIALVIFCFIAYYWRENQNKEGEVYFCCGGCKMDFEEDASKFSTAANFQLLATKQYSETIVCPVTGRKIKSKKEVIVEGLSVGVCCAGCVKKINKSNNKVSMLFSDSAFDKGFAKSKPKSNKK